MSIITIIFIAIGLAMDAFAVSITSGITIKNLKIRHPLVIGLFFGAFQALMPLVGWWLGFNLKDLISGIDHWIVFVLLSLIGCKMIYESNKLKSNKEPVDALNIGTLLILSLATSIDALVIGVSFAFLSISIIIPIIVIGAITFLLSFCGVFIGNRIGHFCESKIEIAGGLVLIAIGLKILIQHLIA